jgi:hypothetical protein
MQYVMAVYNCKKALMVVFPYIIEYVVGNFKYSIGGGQTDVFSHTIKSRGHTTLGPCITTDTAL